jgi:tRNA U34 5-methylaminomethyl-2-thiouridine-forming methyltransferase MnmC
LVIDVPLGDAGGVVGRDGAGVVVVVWVSDVFEPLENPEQAVNRTSDNAVKTRVRRENSRGAFAHTFSAKMVRRQNIDHLVTKFFRDLLDVLQEKT